MIQDLGWYLVLHISGHHASTLKSANLAWTVLVRIQTSATYAQVQITLFNLNASPYTNFSHSLTLWLAPLNWDHASLIHSWQVTLLIELPVLVLD